MESPQQFSTDITAYYMKEKLGKGSQGDVWKVQYRNNGKDYALKVIEKSFQKKNSIKLFNS